MRLQGRRLLSCVRVAMVVWMSGTVLCVYLLQSDHQADLPPPIHTHTMNIPLNCSSGVRFTGTFKENLQKLEKITIPSSEPWLERLGFNTRMTSRVRSSFPVLVTAASSSHFLISQGLVRSVQEKVLTKYPAVQLFYFDLGLRPEEKNLLRRNCKECIMRSFPFNKVPKHVANLYSYAFKPIIVNLMYKEHGHVWWLDASVRLVTDELLMPLRYLRETGILFFTYGSSLNVALHTHGDMFRYFSEDPCNYKSYGEVEAGSIMFRRSHVTDVVLRLWAACALEEGCVAPKDTTRYCDADISERVMSDRLSGACHRYDQSALGIILRRLYHKQNDYPLVETPFKLTTIQRDRGIPYFV
ncbi:uncharacterized protein LOC128217128 [Mya arenaria]|uniref:uncharacterized protein LOC128217128 n=1 Tax=Mya arenaria TaxID=6604 RepID=UPI0022DF61B6|nr:uncharacterized protein LOC128217128 [Mya arenaria]